MPERVVIVGAGAAGVRAAERLRELGFSGELTIVGEEPYRPYHRPALSKELITGRLRPRDLRLPVHAELGATWRFSTRAVYLEPEEHVLHLPGGEEMRYDGLVIATGMQARHLPGAPRHNARVHVLRGIADAVSIQQTLTRGKGALAIIGGGFVASELASSARALGRDATIILRDRSLMANVPGTDFSQTIGALHEANGVQIVTDAYVSHWVSQHQGIAMHLNTGQVVVAACVVLGVGTVPAVAWLRGSGLIIDDGVMCGPTLHAIGAQDIVVAGDVARWPNLRFDSVPRRVEHWQNAIEMGRAAAENLLAGQAAATPFTPLPKFWTEQHGLRIQAAGTPALAQDTVALDGSRNVGHRITGYLSGGNLVGIVGWDSPAGMLKWTAELEKQSSQAMRDRLGRPSRRRPAIRALGPAPRRRELPPASSAGAGSAGAGSPGTSPALRALPPSMRELPPAVVLPTASSPGMFPVRANDSSPGMAPVRPMAGAPGMARVHPTASSPGMAPAASSPGMAPVRATASSPNMAPVRATASSPGMAPVHPNASSPGMAPVRATTSSARMAPVPPTAGSPGMVPARTGSTASTDITPVPPNMSSPNMVPVRATASSPSMAPVRPNASSQSLVPVRATASSPSKAPVHPNGSSQSLVPVRATASAPARSSTTSPGMATVPSSASSQSLVPVRPNSMAQVPPNASSQSLVPVHATASSPSMAPARRRNASPGMASTASSPGMAPARPATSTGRHAAGTPGLSRPTSTSSGMPPVTASSPGMAPARPATGTRRSSDSTTGAHRPSDTSSGTHRSSDSGSGLHRSSGNEPGMTTVRRAPVPPTFSAPGSPGTHPVPSHSAGTRPAMASTRFIPPTAGSPGMPHLPPNASSPGIPRVSPTAGSPGMPRVSPTASSPGMPAVAPNASSPGMPRVAPSAGMPAGPRFVPPTASSSGMRPVTPPPPFLPPAAGSPKLPDLPPPTASESGRWAELPPTSG
jgi:NADPH-dependent 2,4-dienoyl-CoA reductase/sulfur reductase-like enzyme